MDIINVFSDNVKRYRKKSGLSQESLSSKSGLHRTYISSLERGKRSVSLGNIQKIATALEIEPYMLLVDATSGKNDKHKGDGNFYE